MSGSTLTPVIECEDADSSPSSSPTPSLSSSSSSSSPSPTSCSSSSVASPSPRVKRAFFPCSSLEGPMGWVPSVAWSDNEDAPSAMGTGGTSGQVLTGWCVFKERSDTTYVYNKEDCFQVTKQMVHNLSRRIFHMSSLFSPILQASGVKDTVYATLKAVTSELTSRQVNARDYVLVVPPPPPKGQRWPISVDGLDIFCDDACCSTNVHLLQRNSVNVSTVNIDCHFQDAETKSVKTGMRMCFSCVVAAAKPSTTQSTLPFSTQHLHTVLYNESIKL